MLLNFKEQIIQDFQIAEFDLKKSEIIVIEIPSGAKFREIGKELTEIITKLNPEFKYVEHFKQESFINRFFPLTVEKFLKNCTGNSIYKNKIYEIEWMKPYINVHSIAGSLRRKLQLYKTLTETKNIIIDLAGVDPVGGKEIYEILKQNLSDNGTIILYDTCNEFENECTKFIRLKYVEEDENWKEYNELMVNK